MRKKLISVFIGAILIMSMAVPTIAAPNKNQINFYEQSFTETVDNVICGVATPNSSIQPRIGSSGNFSVSYSSDQLPPVLVNSDKFTITDNTCRINMNVRSTALIIPDNHPNVELTIYGPGCGLFGNTITYKIDGGNLGYTFTGLTKGGKYQFEVKMWSNVEITGDITNFDKVL